MKEIFKNIFSFIFRLGLSVGLIAFLFSQMDTAQMLEMIRSADMGYLIAALILFCFTSLMLLVRWRLLIKGLALEVPFKYLFIYFFAGLFFNLFLPTSTGGDVVKIIGVCRVTPHKAKVVASAMLDRLSGYSAIVLIATIAFIFGHRLIDDNTLIFPILFIALAGLTMFSILFNERIYSFGCKAFNRFPKIKNALMQLHYDIVLLKDRKRMLFAAIGVSCCTQTMLACTFYLVARAYHQEISLIYFLIFVPIICVVAAVPSIGGLGVRDAGAAYLFAKIGVDSATAVSLSLTNFAFMAVIGLIGGAIYVIALSPGWVQHHSQEFNASTKEARG